MQVFFSNDSLIIAVLGVLIVVLFGLMLYKNFKKIKIKDRKEKIVNYECSIISKREYITKNNETYYYITFKINDEEREFIVSKSRYFVLNVGMIGIISLLEDKVIVDFIVK